MRSRDWELGIGNEVTKQGSLHAATESTDRLSKNQARSRFDVTSKGEPLPFPRRVRCRRTGATRALGDETTDTLWLWQCGVRHRSRRCGPENFRGTIDPTERPSQCELDPALSRRAHRASNAHQMNPQGHERLGRGRVRRLVSCRVSAVSGMCGMSDEPTSWRSTRRRLLRDSRRARMPGNRTIEVSMKTGTNEVPWSGPMGHCESLDPRIHQHPKHRTAPHRAAEAD